MRVDSDALRKVLPSRHVHELSSNHDQYLYFSTDDGYAQTCASHTDSGTRSSPILHTT